MVKRLKYPLVEVIILTHNGKKNIEICLTSLRKTDYNNLKITVVDQNSKDDTSDFIKKEYPEVNLIINNKNKSFSEGNNDILKISKAKYCILLNDDTKQNPNWVKDLVKIAEKDENIAALQPKVLSMKNKKEFEYAGASGGFIDIYGYPVCRGRIFQKLEEDYRQYNDIRNIFWSCGVAMFLNMKIIKKIGYLDESFESYAEELDLSWRINLAGYEIKVVPKSIIYHLGSASWGDKKLEAKKEYLLQRNHWIILFKNYSITTWLKIIPIKFFLEILTISAFIFKNPKKSLGSIKSMGWLFMNFFTLIEKNKEINKLKKVSDKKIMDKMIRKSVALHFFLFQDRKKFKDYIKFIKDY